LVLVTPIIITYGVTDSALVIVLLSAVEGVIQALGIPAVQAAVARSAPEGRAGAAQGLAGASNLAIGAVTAFSAGSLYALGAEWVFGVAATGVLAFTALAVLQNRAATRAPAT
jgi:sugar phosphate permease